MLWKFVIPPSLYLVVPLVAISQVYPPKIGVEVPSAYFERARKDPSAFRFKRAWIEKARRIRKNRLRFLAGRLAKLQHTPVPLAEGPEGIAVSGTVSVPVLLTKFSSTGADPYPSADLQQELFDGPWPTGTMSDFYGEISYGNLNLAGTVYDWFQLSRMDTYYEGSENGFGWDSKVGQLIKEALVYSDASIDFSQYDNDGPDGIPNSGDDDGYVDFISIIQAESGGECGNSNIWSHRWVYSGWPESGGAPFTTGDPSASGGYIKVDDYTMQPALSCDNTTMIEIGVFCHEFAHAFGLPDLYDINGGSAGIGHWGLMGSGSWNSPFSPAHMCAWSKAELGWIIPEEIGPEPASYSIQNVEYNPEAYVIPIIDERWRRSTLCAINGSYSMHLGLNSTEASARNWPGGEGYGNGWKESILREFIFDGTTPVTLSYNYAYKTEATYDFAYVKIKVDGFETTLRTYDGTGSGSELGIDLSSYLDGSGASSYELIFEFKSDYFYSDEDGYYNSSCGGPFTIDDVAVSGGGENYFTDFEEYEDGWHEDAAGSVDEYFLVENRERNGFDQYLLAAGLAVWHVEQNIMVTKLGNTGGSSGEEPHGLALEEADGLGHLMNNANRGDAGDVFPGSTNNLLFDSTSSPSSNTNEGETTIASISSISSPGSTMSAVMQGGAFPPTAASVFPNTGNNGSGVVRISVFGSAFNYGAAFWLENNGGYNRNATAVEWIGHEKISGDIDLTGLTTGLYDVVVQNPDSQQAVLTGAFTVTEATAAEHAPPPDRFALYQNYPNPFNPATIIPFDLPRRSYLSLTIYDIEGRLVKKLVRGEIGADHYEIEWDGSNEAGEKISSGIYFCRLITGDRFKAVRKLVKLE